MICFASKTIDLFWEDWNNEEESLTFAGEILPRGGTLVIDTFSGHGMSSYFLALRRCCANVLILECKYSCIPPFVTTTT